MVEGSIRFGEELRRRRLAVGLSLTGLALRIHYSKSQLSKVERGIKRPSPGLVSRCDAELKADGALVRLALETSDRPEVTDEGIERVPMNGEDEVWVMEMSVDGPNRFRPLSRRQAVTAGAASLAVLGTGGPKLDEKAEDTSLLGLSRTLFDQYRRLGQSVDPGLLLPVLIAQTHTLRELAARTGPRLRRELLRLGSRYAEYVGWLVQETGDERTALWWTQRAVDLAIAGDDHQLAAYGFVRHALVTLYRREAAQTVDLAARAQKGKVAPRVRGLAAQREAQGHALAGDYDACMRNLDRARALLARHVPDSEAPVIGTTNLADPAEMIKGWCLYDLGRPRAAVEVLDGQLALVPPQALRTRVRYGVRQALAYAAAGEVDHACQLAHALLDGAVTVGSATIAVDLCALARTLARHPRNASVRALTPELGSALQSITPQKG